MSDRPRASPAAGRRRVLAYVPMAAALAGLGLVAGVAGAKLTRSGFAHDLDTICNAEARSGRRLDRGMAQVSAWTLAHLTTPEGGALFARVRDLPAHEGASLLRQAVNGENRCALANAYDDLAREGEYRADIQRACSRFTFPALTDVPPPLRVQQVAEQLETSALSTQARAVAAAIRLAPSAHESAALLRSASIETDSYSCDVAAALEAAPPLACTER